METDKKTRGMIVGIGVAALLFLALMTALLVWAARPQIDGTLHMAYTQAVSSFKSMQVRSFTLDLHSGALAMTLRDGRKAESRTEDIGQFLELVVEERPDGQSTLLEQYNKQYPDDPMIYQLEPKRNG